MTDEHLAAAGAFREAWEAARIGQAGPSPDPARKAEVMRVVGALGRWALPLLVHVVVKGEDIASWCRARREEGQAADPQKVLGGLLVILDRLVELRA